MGENPAFRAGQECHFPFFCFKSSFLSPGLGREVQDIHHLVWRRMPQESTAGAPLDLALCSLPWYHPTVIPWAGWGPCQCRAGSVAVVSLDPGTLIQAGLLLVMADLGAWKKASPWSVGAVPAPETLCYLT